MNPLGSCPTTTQPASRCEKNPQPSRARRSRPLHKMKTPSPSHRRTHRRILLREKHTVHQKAPPKTQGYEKLVDLNWRGATGVSFFILFLLSFRTGVCDDTNGSHRDVPCEV